jgi:hypothetical protein
MEVPPHRQRHQREPGADDERDAPAPRTQLLRAEEQLLKHQQYEDRAQLPADEGHILEARIEPAVSIVRHLTE